MAAVSPAARAPLGATLAHAGGDAGDGAAGAAAVVASGAGALHTSSAGAGEEREMRAPAPMPPEDGTLEALLPQAMRCTACQGSINEEEAEAGVVRMDACLWHMDCFRCIKCGGDVLGEQENVMLVGGQPMCSACTFTCRACHEPIAEEAVMCDQEPYHPACFRCSACGRQIDSNVFARAPDVLFCMTCHEQDPSGSAPPEETQQIAHQRSVSGSSEQALSVPHSPQRKRAGSVGSTATATSTATGTSAGDADAPASDVPAKSERFLSAGSARLPSGDASPSHRRLPGDLSPRRRLPRRSTSSTMRSVEEGQATPQDDSLSSQADASVPALEPPAELRSPQAPPARDTKVRQAEVQTSPYVPSTHQSPVSRRSSEIDSMPAGEAARRSLQMAERSLQRLQQELAQEEVAVISQTDVAPGAEREPTMPGSFALPDEDAAALRRASLGARSSASSFDRAYDRLSEMLHLDILQEYSSMGSRPDSFARTEASEAETTQAAQEPPATLDAARALRASTERELAGRTQPGSRTSQRLFSSHRDPARASALLRARPNSEVDVLRSFKGWDAECDSLLAELGVLTPNQVQPAASTQPDAERGRTAPEPVDLPPGDTAHAATGAEARTATAAAADAAADATAASAAAAADSSVDTPATAPQPAPSAPDSAPSTGADSTSLAHLEIERCLALAELLAIEDVAAKPTDPAQPNGEAIRTKVDLVIDTLMAHLDTVKQRFRGELQTVVSLHSMLHQQTQQMLQVRNELVLENQQLLARAQQLSSYTTDLENRAARLRTPQPAPAAPEAPTPDSSSTAASSTASKSQSRLDASLPPTPISRRFRWIKPRLIASRELAALRPLLMQGPVDAAASLAENSPPVPPKESSSGSVASGGASDEAASGRSAPPPPPPPEPIREHLHVFQPSNVLRPTARCLVCQRGLWGQQELRCANCQMVCHTRCVAHVSTMCPLQPASAAAGSGTAAFEAVARGPRDSLPPVLFGRALQEQVLAEGGVAVPRLVNACIEVVESQGLHFEGLYRKSGSHQQQKLIQQLFESGVPFNLADRAYFNDISAIMGALKQYLRMLPDPLLVSALHDQFLELSSRVARTPAAEITAALRELCASLPPAHLATLRRLVLHLHTVQQHGMRNKMNSKNLGLVFGPTIMRSPDPARELLETGAQSRLAGFLIEHAPAVFA